MASVDTTASVAPLLTPNLEGNAALELVVGLIAPEDEDEGAVADDTARVLFTPNRGPLEPTVTNKRGKTLT